MPRSKQAGPTADVALSQENEAFRKNEEGIRRDIVGNVVAEGLQDDAPYLSKAELDQILPEVLPDSAYSEQWTREDEAALDQRWQTDPRRTDPMVVGNPQMHKVFKILVRLFRVSPLEIISSKHRLEWDSVFNGAGVHWSGGFCSNISEIAAHPLWEGNVRLLAIALQYAVILRTEDRRSWAFERPNDHPLFMAFQQLIEEYRDQGKEISFIHEKVRARLQDQGRPAFSVFLSRLEEQDIATLGSVADPERMVYAVAAIDVTRIKKALDEVRQFGHRVFYNTELIYDLAIARRNSYKDVPSNSQTKTYMERAWKAYRRIEAQFEKTEQERLERLARGPEEVTRSVSTGVLDDATSESKIQGLLADKERYEAELTALKAVSQAQETAQRAVHRVIELETRVRTLEAEKLAEKRRADAAEQTVRELEMERELGMQPMGQPLDAFDEMYDGIQ